MWTSPPPMVDQIFRKNTASPQKKWNDSGSIFLNFQVSNSSQTTRQTWTPFPIRTDCVGQEETFCSSMLSETCTRACNLKLAWAMKGPKHPGPATGHPPIVET